MDKYFCNPCGYTYDPEKGDPEHGIKPGTAFEDLPDDWCCPICGVTKDMFMRVIQQERIENEIISQLKSRSNGDNSLLLYFVGDFKESPTK